MSEMFMPQAIGERIRTQDNRSTNLPIFLVQQKERIYGFDADYFEPDHIVWRHCDGFEASEEDRKPLDYAWECGNDIPEEWTRTAWMDEWRFVMPFFTEAAAQRYIDENRHNLKEPRIYVESGYRNHEWKAIRDFFLSLDAAAEEVGSS